MFFISKGEEMTFQGKDNYMFQITNAKNELELLKGNERVK